MTSSVSAESTVHADSVSSSAKLRGDSPASPTCAASRIANSGTSSW